MKGKRKRSRKPPTGPAAPDGEDFTRDLFSFRDLATYNDPRYISKAFSNNGGAGLGAGAFNLYKAELEHVYASEDGPDGGTFPVPSAGPAAKRNRAATSASLIAATNAALAGRRGKTKRPRLGAIGAIGATPPTHGAAASSGSSGSAAAPARPVPRNTPPSAADACPASHKVPHNVLLLGTSAAAAKKGAGSAAAPRRPMSKAERKRMKRDRDRDRSAQAKCTKPAE